MYNLAKLEHVAGELRCGDFNALSGKSNLAYHYARLREAGLIQTRISGTTRFIRLRRDDLEARFPGMLTTIISAATRDAARLQLPECEIATEA
ncbi:putative transcriptional regulatory protein (fragment) [Bradyrhizobium sp. ORS 278]